MHDLFMPVSCDCVEDEPDTTDNCKRDEFRVKASMADAVVMKGHGRQHQICKFSRTQA